MKSAESLVDAAAADPRPFRRPLRRLLLRAGFWAALYRGSTALLVAAACYSVGGFVLAGFDWLVPMTSEASRFAWMLMTAVAVWRGTKSSGGGGDWSARGLLLTLGRSLDPPDAVLNVWELARAAPRPGISPELVVVEIRRLLGKASGPDPRRAMRPAGWRRRTTVAAAVLSVAGATLALSPSTVRATWWRSLNPFAPVPSLAGLTVEPGDLNVPWGEDVAVRVRVEGHAEPELWVRTAALSWERRPLEAGRPGDYGALFQNLLEPVAYRVRYQGRWSHTYTLTPFRPPRFESLRAVLHPPRYTGRPPETLENVFSYRVLRGTRVALSGRLDRAVGAAVAVFPDGRAQPARVDGGATVSLTIDAFESGEFRLRFEGGGLPVSDQNEAVFRIQTEEDRPPAVRILSPAQDLVVSAREKIPVVVEVTDDYGVGEVALNVTVNGGPLQKIPWSGPEGSERVTLERTLSLDAFRVKGGDELRYHVAARDNNTLGGPAEGISAVFLARVASYEEEHARFEGSLEDIHKALLAALAEESLVRASLDEASPDWPSLAAKQEALARRLGETGARLEALLKNLERDPLMDQVSLAEYQGLSRALGELARETAPRARDALAARAAAPAARALDETVAELERLSLLGEDILQAKRMRDLLQRQDDLTASAESLRDGLVALRGAPLSPEDRQKFQEMLEEMARLTSAIAGQLEKMPQGLPEDFINQPGVKEIRFDEAQRAMDDMQKALAAGDAAAALAHAERALQRLRDIQKRLQEAGGKSPGGPSWFGGPLAEDTERFRRAVGDLVRRQEALKARAQTFAQAAVDALLAAQRRALTDEARRQSTTRAELDRFADGVETSPAAAKISSARPRLLSARTSLKRFLDELAASRPENALAVLRETKDLLRDVDEALGAARAKEAPSSKKSGDAAALADWQVVVHRFRGEVESALDRLAPPASDRSLLSESQNAELPKVAAEQDALRADTLAVRRDVMALARKTALIPPGLWRRLRAAAEAMEEAVAELGAARLRPAVAAQETALHHLRDGADAMEDAAQGARGLQKGVGRPAAGTIQGVAAAGAVGTQSAPLRFPRAEDFRPPKEFREELLKSMKEKYPKAYERLIRDYYERWAK